MSDATRILEAIDLGDPQAAEQLLPLVYEELRRLAAQRLADEKPGQTLQATAQVHEAYLRLVGSSDQRGSPWNSRGHFFAAAAEAMRRILIDNARQKARPKHGGDRRRIEFDELDLADESAADDVLALDESLEKLATVDQTIADVVKLRYFAGLTIQETAANLDISVRTANRHWAYAKAWLFRELEEGEEFGI